VELATDRAGPSDADADGGTGARVELTTGLLYRLARQHGFGLTDLAWLSIADLVRLSQKLDRKFESFDDAVTADDPEGGFLL
jgi:hypothetical protein